MNFAESSCSPSTGPFKELSTPTHKAGSASSRHDRAASMSISQSETSSSPSEVTEAEAPTASEQTIPHGVNEDIWGPLPEDQQRVIESVLLDPVQITFDTNDEDIRAHSKILPRIFYRTFYETSATLCRYVTVDTHVKHRTRKDLKINNGNAFQAIAEFHLREYLHREGIERQLIWNKKVDPSAYISVFNSIFRAICRAYFHGETSQRIGQRVCIAGIRTKGLIPATVRAKCESTIKIFRKTSRKLELRNPIKCKKFTRNVDIPVWIDKKAKDQYGCTITPEQLEDSEADIWLSITEIRSSNLKEQGPEGSKRRDHICAKGHDYEWLCCGAILESRIKGVWPWENDKLYFNDCGSPIRSLKNSGQPWIWSWAKKMWLPELCSGFMATPQIDNSGNKRKHFDDEAVQHKKQKTEECDCSKSLPTLSMSTINSVQTCPMYPLTTTTL